jgi:two-component system, sensor histidine kinase RegB
VEFQPLIRPPLASQPTLDTARWLLHLRWVAVAGQLVTIGVVYWGLRIELPLWGLLGLIAITAATNLAYALWLRYLGRTSPSDERRLPGYQVVAGLMLLDMLTLTTMLYLSGSMQNPFALFYFANIAVAGVILTPAWAWGLWILAVFSVLTLLTVGTPLPGLMLDSPGTRPMFADLPIMRLGVLISFATCGGVITYFITVLTGELKQREQKLQAAEDERLRARQLEGLATLAAGAGHELATPLSTIAVVSKELGRALEKFSLPPAIMQDVSLIRSELDRCRQILDRMASAAGEAAGERLHRVTVEGFFKEVMLGVREPHRVLVQIDGNVADQTNLLPVQATAQAVRNLIQNALDASQPGADIQIKADAAGDAWRLRVVDRGDGMTPEVLERVGQPFFTTKEPGRGMGLGLYLTQNVIHRLGGRLNYSSRPGHGTTAEVVLPCKRK